MMSASSKLIVVATTSEGFTLFIDAGVVTDCVRTRARTGYHLAGR